MSSRSPSAALPAAAPRSASLSPDESESYAFSAMIPRRFDVDAAGYSRLCGQRYRHEAYALLVVAAARRVVLADAHFLSEGQLRCTIAPALRDQLEQCISRRSISQSEPLHAQPQQTRPNAPRRAHLDALRPPSRLDRASLHAGRVGGRLIARSGFGERASRSSAIETVVRGNAGSSRASQGLRAVAGRRASALAYGTSAGDGSALERGRGVAQSQRLAQAPDALLECLKERRPRRSALMTRDGPRPGRAPALLFSLAHTSFTRLTRPPGDRAGLTESPTRDTQLSPRSRPRNTFRARARLPISFLHRSLHARRLASRPRHSAARNAARRRAQRCVGDPLRDAIDRVAQDVADAPRLGDGSRGR